MSTEPPDPHSPASGSPSASEPEPVATPEPEPVAAPEPVETPEPAVATTVPAAPAAAAPRPSSTLTWALVGVALVVAGFLGGYFVGHHANDHGGRSAFVHHRFGGARNGPGPRFGGFPGTSGGLNPQTGSPGQGGFPVQGDFIVGTVTRVSGSTVYLRERDGTSVTVQTSGATVVRVGNSGNVSSLPTGATVVVRGIPGAKGVIEASVIAQVGRYASGTATT